MIEIEEAIKAMRMIIEESFKEHHSIKISEQGVDTIYLVDTESDYSSGQSLAMSSVFEKIFVITGYFVTAAITGKNNDGHYISVYMHHKDKLQGVNKDGIYWEDTKYRAKCPECGDRASFSLMRFNPKDQRDSKCPKCGDTHTVRSMYVLDEGEAY